MDLLRKPERRAERTRDALFAAFRDLVLTRGFDEITVLELIERANVGRSTFYEHFENKEQLLRESLAPMLDVLARSIVGTDVDPSIAIVLDHLRENRVLTHALLAGATRAIAATILAERITAHCGHARVATLVPLATTAVVLAAGQLAFMSAWIDESEARSADEAATQFCCIARAFRI